MKTFICTNDEQLIPAKISRHILLKYTNLKPEDITILNESSFNELHDLYGSKYLRSGKWEIWNSTDMQRFTLLRFLVPELMSFSGHAIVMDPDIFLVKNKLPSLMEKISSTDVLCRKGVKENTNASSLMVLNCQNLRHWKLPNLIRMLKDGALDYDDLINIRFGAHRISYLDNSWNDFDNLDENTIFLHTTQKITQPWRKGLKMNSYVPKIFGIFKRDLIYRILKKPLRVGVEHPNEAINDLFFRYMRDAYKEKIISDDDIKIAIQKKFLRQDIYGKLHHSD